MTLRNSSLATKMIEAKFKSFGVVGLSIVPP
jgi:hypothetical protein